MLVPRAVQDSTTTRTQSRYKLYTVKMHPGAQIHPAFKERSYNIAIIGAYLLQK